VQTTDFASHRPAAHARGALLALALVLAGCATAPPEGDFRGFDWGASKTAVKDGEDAELIIEPADQLIYHADYRGLDTTLTYRFQDGRLVQARYLNRERHADSNAFIDDFKRIKGRLIDRYGLPRTDRRQWRNRLFADRPDRWGEAVAAGHLVYYTQWIAGNTKIVMTLHADRLQVAHEIVFSEYEQSS